MQVNTVADGKTLNVYLSGEIDHCSAPRIRETIDDRVTECRPCVLRLDFSAVSFMDSSGVGLVMGRYRHARGLGCVTEVTNLTPRYERIMKMSGLEKIVTFPSKFRSGDESGKNK